MGIDKLEIIVKLLKIKTAAQLTQIESILKCDIEPKREDCITEEEYLAKMKSFNIEMINSVEQLKKRLFNDVLDSYNNYLQMKYTAEKELKKQNEASAAYILYSGKDIKNSGIASLVTTLLIPSAFPIIAAIGLTRISFDTLQAKINLNRINKNNDALQKIKLVQDPFYEFTCTLRTDYHESKKKFEELKERANNGETIIPELIEMVNPEKVALERTQGAVVFVEKGEKPKQLTKHKEK